MDISFTSNLHRSLYKKVHLGDADAIEKAWASFVVDYENFEHYGKRWLDSRLSGVSPLTLGIPWINFPAIDYLDREIKKKFICFEWGMGGSTAYLRNRASSVISVEHDLEWFLKCENQIDNGRLIFDLAIFKKNRSQLKFIPPSLHSEDKVESFRSGVKKYAGMSFEDYVLYINKWPDYSFDLVLVDGRSRPACLRAAINKVKPDGILMLDNSDYSRYQASLEGVCLDLLPDWKKIEFLGPGPCSSVIGWKTTAWRRPDI
jgi:hypothetical protein